MTTNPPKQSDLGVRAASAVVMVAVAGTALWLGGWVWTAFVALVALGVLWEWSHLAFKFTKNLVTKLAWVAAGLVYVGVAAWQLVDWRLPYDGLYRVGLVVVAVIGVDVGAYCAGRLIGGPKIAPTISPSKTWAGLFGGALGGGLLFAAAEWAWPAGLCSAYIGSLTEPPLPPGVFAFDDRCHLAVPPVMALFWHMIVVGLILAVFAQIGDFFESWMKRRAGVKDSGKLIPGHGGLFDRVDGLLAISFLSALPSLLFHS